jgi:hypothetical protein
VQCPITEIVGTVVVKDVDVVAPLVVDVSDGEVGIGAPVEKRHPAPGGLNAAMLTTGGGRFFEGCDGCDGCVVDVVGVVDVEDRSVVVGSEAVVDGVVRSVVVVAAAGER